MFSEVDVSGDDEIDQGELGELLSKMLQKEAWKYADNVVKARASRASSSHQATHKSGVAPLSIGGQFARSRNLLSVDVATRPHARSQRTRGRADGTAQRR